MNVSVAKGAGCAPKYKLCIQIGSSFHYLSTKNCILVPVNCHEIYNFNVGRRKLNLKLNKLIIFLHIEKKEKPILKK